MKPIAYNNRILDTKGKIFGSEKRPNTLKDGLVDYWTFDTDASTSTSSGNNGSVIGATLASGKINNGYSFTGTNYITVGNGTTYKYFHETGKFSVAVWMKLSNYNNDAARVIVSCNSGASASRGMSIIYENRASASSPKFMQLSVTRGTMGTVSINYVTANNIITDDNWHHIVYTCIPSGSTYNVNFYLDGVLRTGGSLTVANSLLTGNSDTMIIGATTSGLYGFGGMLDELGFWNRPLMYEEVIQLYDAGSGRQYPF